MNYAAWQLKRRELSEREKAERSENWDQARAGLQASITEQAVRELYDKIAALEEKIGTETIHFRGVPITGDTGEMIDQFEGLRKFAASIEERMNRMENASREIGQYKRGPGRPPKEAE